MDRSTGNLTPPHSHGLTPDQIEAIARQLPGRQERDLMRLQQAAEGEAKSPRTPYSR